MLGEKGKEINKQNHDLIHQVKQFDKNILELGVLQQKYATENKQLLRELNLNEDSIKEYAKQGFKMAKEVCYCTF